MKRKTKSSAADAASALSRTVATGNGVIGSGELDQGFIFGAQSIQMIRQTMFNPLRGFNPRRLVNWVEEQQAGYLSDPLRAWEAMSRRDGQIFTVKQKAEQAVCARPWNVMEYSDHGGSEQEVADQKARRKYFWNNVKACSAWDRNNIGKFAKFVELTMEAEAMRYGMIHIVWRPTPKGLTATLEFIPGWLCENITGELRFLGANPARVYGQAVDPTNWLALCGRGIMEPASIGYGFKHLALNSWVKYCGRYGMPFRLGKTGATPGSLEWRAMENAVRGMGEDAAAVVGNGASIELLEAGGSGTGPSESLVENIDRGFSAMWTGGDLSTMSSKQGQGTGATAQASQGLILEAGRCRNISEVMQRIEALVDAWYDGEGTESLVYGQVKGPDLEDVQLAMEVDEFLISNGARISTRETLQRYNRTEADEGETDILKAVQIPRAPMPEPANLSVNYSPTQPRASDEKWTAGGGSGGQTSLKSVSSPHEKDSRNEDHRGLEGEDLARVAAAVRGGEAGAGTADHGRHAQGPGGSADHASKLEVEGQEQRLAAMGEAPAGLSRDKKFEGGEHVVSLSEDGRRVIKRTKPGGYGFVVTEDVRPGATGDLQRLQYRHATPAQYFERQAIMDKVFKLKTKFEGVEQHEGHLSVVTSQKFVEPKDAENPHPQGKEGQKAIEKFMGDHGFEEVIDDGRTYYHPKHKILVSDARPQNFIAGKDGELHPIGLIANHYDREKLATNAAPDAETDTVPADVTQALLADLEPLRQALAEALQDPGKIADLDLSPLTNAVLGNDQLTQSLAGQLCQAFLIGAGCSPAAAQALMAHAVHSTAA